ncbi:granzyme G-like [Embiotoca jacksoni]|uniref:granzyme G-like n=1 Tax=Embiotoca jacksoni TaxID=100190 RepID=UPI0037045733
MFLHCKLATLMLILTLDCRVHTGEIIGGHEAEAHSRPHMVLLERHMDGGHKTYCGGFLLNEEFVMTAAHCHAKSYQVILGLHNFNTKKDIQRVSVGRTFPHKGYNRSDFKDDIMLLQLSAKANINNNVKPIALADQGDDSLPKPCSVAGWGQTELNKYLSHKLMEVSVALIDNKMCTERNMYCSEGKTGPGNGDSGGPLVCGDEKAYGVVAVNIIKERQPTLYVYTKIPNNRDWIDCIMKHDENC